MSNNLVIKNDSFIQSMHNDIQCIESLDPNDKGTSRQYWFSASMLANIFDIALNTVKNNVDFLVKWGEVTIVKNLTIVQTQNSVGAVKDTTLYDLQVFNKLAMQLRTDAAMEIRNKFSDILVEIETTGQYNVQRQDPSYMIEDPIERAKAWIREQEEKRALEAEKKALEDKTKELEDENEQLEADNEILTQQRDKAIQTKQQISDSKTAKALGRVGGLVTANNRLKDELYLNRNYRTIGAIAQLNGISENSLNWRLLKSYCNEHDLEVMKIQGVRFKINVYPIESFRAIYPELRVD